MKVGSEFVLAWEVPTCYARQCPRRGLSLRSIKSRRLKIRVPKLTRNVWRGSLQLGIGFKK